MWDAAQPMIQSAQRREHAFATAAARSEQLRFKIREPWRALGQENLVRFKLGRGRTRCHAQPCPPTIRQRGQPVVRETEFCGLRLAGDFRRRTRENGRNSVRRPRHVSLTDRNCEGFCRPGNRVGLPGLGCRDRTDGHRSLASLQNEAARRGFRARNDLTQRMSKSLGQSRRR